MHIKSVFSYCTLAPLILDPLIVVLIVAGGGVLVLVVVDIVIYLLQYLSCPPVCHFSVSVCFCSVGISLI